MDRIVVLSDPSKEFPGNKTNSFKSRLPREVQFEGDWEVGLTSISMPDRGLDLRSFLSEGASVVRLRYQLLDESRNSRTTRVEDVWRNNIVKNASIIVDGVGLMKALINEIEWEIIGTLQGIANGVVEDARRPTFRWKGEMAILEKKDIGVLGSHPGNNVVEFSVNIILALHMQWLEVDERGVYNLGPNLRYSLYDSSIKKSKRVSSTELTSDRLWIVDSGSLVLSFTVEWHFLNLNKAFQYAVNHTSRTLLVYSDVVSSNIMGDAEHPLIREVHYIRSGGGDVYFEPTHIGCPCVVVIWMSSKSVWPRVMDVWLSWGKVRGPSSPFSSGNDRTRTYKMKTHHGETFIILSLCVGVV